MKTLAMRYENTPLVSKTYDTMAIHQGHFDPVWLSDALPTVKSETGRLLNGRAYSHIYYSYKTVNVVISADEFGEGEGVKEFFKSFWTAQHKYIAFHNGSTDTYGDILPNAYDDYIEVVAGDGTLPLEYIDNLIDLPEITFTFEYTEVQ